MEILRIVMIVLAALLALKILTLPMRLLGKLALNAAAGVILLIVFNTVGALVGLQLGINLLNILVTGILGLPGLAVLLLARWILTV